ncbi:hypothetical protein PR202_ga17138 [Eleusine coracana subsp. coracana]|uniref:C2 domain-containing protein n=1 Tax=Eleusine coracana subsp. coracana TaxID=191504 RepID=A0AAV5CPQ8_ELECO|nr:hypothetical protein PR202_ga17138 [Eleusine coracana subsp. coracana]
MRLLVRVVEARGLPATEAGDGLRDLYARARLGKQRAKTKVARRTLSPAWEEEFAFRVGDLRDQLLVAVLHEDRYFADDVLGQVKVPLSAVLDADNRTLGTQWYQLEPKSKKKSKIKECVKPKDAEAPAPPFPKQDNTSGKEMPESLSGGVLLDEVYAIAPSDLNTLLFSPSSDFLQSLAEIQGTTGLEVQQWKLENDDEILKRIVSYTKAPTKLVKAVKATEDMTYMKADGEMFAVLADVSTP